MGSNLKEAQQCVMKREIEQLLSVLQRIELLRIILELPPDREECYQEEIFLGRISQDALNGIKVDISKALLDILFLPGLIEHQNSEIYQLIDQVLEFLSNTGQVFKQLENCSWKNKSKSNNVHYGIRCF